MKLTNMIRDAFIDAAMADVPKVDYDEQARSLGNKTLREAQQKVFPGIDLDATAEWFDKRHVSMPRPFSGLYAPALSGYVLKENDKVWIKLEALASSHATQKAQRDALRSKLQAVAYSCTTRKALADLLPEFEKYLPADTPASVRTLPAIANVVSDFAKAGWPKTQPKKGA